MRDRYTINFPLHMAQCESNYWLALKLMPEMDARDVWQFAVEVPGGSWEMRIEVTERMRYTSTIKVTRQDEVESRWLKMPELTVRLYHDANIAEVLAWEGHRKLEVRYDYPNEDMYQADEKAQFNRFLGDWLSLCLQNGHSLADLSDLVR